MKDLERFKLALERIADGNVPPAYRRSILEDPADYEADNLAAYARHVLNGGDPEVSDFWGDQ